MSYLNFSQLTLKNKCNFFVIIDYEKKKAIPSFVDRIFGGELTSTIMCDDCRTVSGYCGVDTEDG